jgi:hypothetical protein
MSNPREEFEKLDQYTQMTDETERRRQEQHAKNADPQSHLHAGGLFDRKRAKVLVALDEEKLQDEQAAKRSIKRQGQISQTVEDALVNRVHEPTGVHVMKVGWEEHLRIRKDPSFEPFSKYAFNIMNKTDGTPRQKPLRPFLENEVGMISGRIVVLESMPDEGRGNIPYVQVPVQLEAEKDPFAPAFRIIEGGKKE